MWGFINCQRWNRSIISHPGIWLLLYALFFWNPFPWFLPWLLNDRCYLISEIEKLVGSYNIKWTEIMKLNYLRSTNFGSSAGPATGFMFGLNSIARQMRSSIESWCNSILLSCRSLFVVHHLYHCAFLLKLLRAALCQSFHSLKKAVMKRLTVYCSLRFVASFIVG